MYTVSALLQNSLPQNRVCPLLLRSKLIAFLCSASVLRLFARATLLKRDMISELQGSLSWSICVSVTPSLATIKKRRVASLCVRLNATTC